MCQGTPYNVYYIWLLSVPRPADNAERSAPYKGSVSDEFDDNAGLPLFARRLVQSLGGRKLNRTCEQFIWRASVVAASIKSPKNPALWLSLRPPSGRLCETLSRRICTIQLQ